VTYFTHSGKVLCGGALITYNKILTAAHCTINTSNIALHSVVIGSNHFSNVNRYRIVRIFRHEKYSAEHRGAPLNDIAIIEVIRTVRIFSLSISTVSGYYYYPVINRNYSMPYNREKLYVSGFGRTRTDSDTSKKLRTTTVKIISRRRCAVTIHNLTLDNRICALSPGNDACTGDSGSVLYGYRPSGSGIRGNGFVIYGIVSFGIQCAHPTLPGIYVRVSRYADWISGVLAVEPAPNRQLRWIITVVIIVVVFFLVFFFVFAIPSFFPIRHIFSNPAIFIYSYRTAWAKARRSMQAYNRSQLIPNAFLSPRMMKLLGRPYIAARSRGYVICARGEAAAEELQKFCCSSAATSP